MEQHAGKHMTRTNVSVEMDLEGITVKVTDNHLHFCHASRVVKPFDGPFTFWMKF